MIRYVGCVLGVRSLLVAALVLFSHLNVFAQAVYCVRPGATGANNGSDWNNAYSSLPANLQRGATYYLADGNYAGRTFDTPTSGSAVITIKKATAGIHGPASGWNDAYGDGQAVFSGDFRFETGYWEIDGVTGGGPGSWTSGHGIRILAGIFNCNPDFINQLTYFRFRHIEFAGGFGSYVNGGFITAQKVNDLQASHCYFHDGPAAHIGANIGPFNNFLFEYNYFGTFCRYCSAAEHGEVATMQYGGMNGFVFRWSIVSDIGSQGSGTTGGLLTSGQNYEIYGNVFNRPAGVSWNYGGDGVIGPHILKGWLYQNSFIYNNTFINVPSNTIGPASGNTTGNNNCKNNYFYNSGTGLPNGIYNTTHNHFQDSGVAAGSNATSGSGNPFQTLDMTSANFAKLNSDTTAADTSISSIYRTDWWGVTGSTRGALQFGNAGLSANAGPDQQVTLPDNANLAGSYVNLLGGLVSLSWSKVSGPGTVSFGSPSAATTTATFSTAGTHVLRLTATVLLVSAFDDVTVTVQNPPDTVVPTVSLTSPASGTTVSNAVAIAATASDNAGGSGVASVTFLVDGVSVGTDATSPYSLNWDSRTVANGSHSLQARAVDAAGNQATSSSFSINVQNVVDTTPPAVTVTAPGTGSTVSNTVTATVNAIDNAGGSGVASVVFLVDGSNVGSDSSAPYSLVWDSRTVANGIHTLQARALDAAGNQATSATINLNVQNAAPSLADGLAGYWMFDETTGASAVDSSGNGNGASLLNGVTHAGGRSGNAAGFDGVDDYVRVANDASLEPSGALTISAWVNLQSNGGWQSLASKVLQEGSHAYPYSAYELFVEDVGGAYRARLGVSGVDGNRVYADGTTALNYGTWYHLVATYDSSTVRIYVNGAQEGSAPYTSALLQTGQPLFIGRNGIGADVLKGAIDDLRIYGRALTASDVQALYLYNGTPPASPAPPAALRVVQAGF